MCIRDSAIRERIAAGVPFLGICLGMHLMFEEGVELSLIHISFRWRS